MEKHAGRREFLKRLVATGAGAYGLSQISSVSCAAGDALPSRSKVVVVRSAALGPFEGRPQPDQGLLTEMLSRGMKELTGETSAMKAWAKLFKPEDQVSIKVNCLGGPRCSTRPELANAVAASVQMAGVAPDNIIIWDRAERELAGAGFVLNREGPGVRCY